MLAWFTGKKVNLSCAINGLSMDHPGHLGLILSWPSGSHPLTEYVIRFYKTNPNRTSGKIKLTPPVDSYTIVLNGSFRPCEGPDLARISGLLVASLIMLARRFFCGFCYISTTREQHSPVISSLDSNHGLPPFGGLTLAHPATLHLPLLCEHS